MADMKFKDFLERCEPGELIQITYYEGGYAFIYSEILKTLHVRDKIPARELLANEDHGYSQFLNLNVELVASRKRYDKPEDDPREHFLRVIVGDKVKSEHNLRSMRSILDPKLEMWLLNRQGHVIMKPCKLKTMTNRGDELLDYPIKKIKQLDSEKQQIFITLDTQEEAKYF